MFNIWPRTIVVAGLGLCRPAVSRHLENSTVYSREIALEFLKEDGVVIKTHCAFIRNSFPRPTGAAKFAKREKPRLLLATAGSRQCGPNVVRKAPESGNRRERRSADRVFERYCFGVRVWGYPANLPETTQTLRSCARRASSLNNKTVGPSDSPDGRESKVRRSC